MKNREIDISVCIITYFHEKYIEKAIESVLIQKTKYLYEIVISDDCSADKTISIIKEYEKKYPNIIRININETNIGIPANIFKARSMCKGRYIMGLSGDDYWIDEYKMQKQCDFLETHPEYFIAACSFEMRYDDDITPVKVLPVARNRNREYTITEYERGEVLYLHGFMMRNSFLTIYGRSFFEQAQKISDKVDDAVDVVLFIKYGKIYIMGDVLNVYRSARKKKGKHNYNSKFSRIEKMKNSTYLYNQLFNKFGHEINFKNKYISIFSIAWLYMILDKNWSGYVNLYKSIPYEYRHPIYKSVLAKSILKLMQTILEKAKRNFLVMHK